MVMDEFQLINKIKQNTYHQSNIQKGIGDDAAVFDQPNDSVVTAVDLFVENIHFTRETLSPWQIGYKALTANLSDIAAMGATPSYYLVAIVIPNSWTSSEIADIFSGMKSLAQKYSIDLIGGDTVSGERFTLSITIIGHVKNERARYRHLAKDNDIVFVTGTLGNSQAGLYLPQNKNLRHLDKGDYFIKQLQEPTPRVNFSRALSLIPRMALNDISDGIANEAAEIAEASKVSIHLFEQSIPTNDALKQFSIKQSFKWVYFGGEDYELIGTVSKEYWSKVVEIAEKTNTPIKKVGFVKENKAGKVLLYQSRQHRPMILNKQGFTHLR